MVIVGCDIEDSLTNYEVLAASSSYTSEKVDDYHVDFHIIRNRPYREPLTITYLVSIQDTHTAEIEEFSFDQINADIDYLYGLPKTIELFDSRTKASLKGIFDHTTTETRGGDGYSVRIHKGKLTLDRGALKPKITIWVQTK